MFKKFGSVLVVAVLAGVIPLAMTATQYLLDNGQGDIERLQRFVSGMAFLCGGVAILICNSIRVYRALSAAMAYEQAMFVIAAGVLAVLATTPAPLFVSVPVVLAITVFGLNRWFRRNMIFVDAFEGQERSITFVVIGHLAAAAFLHYGAWKDSTTSIIMATVSVCAALFAVLCNHLDICKARKATHAVETPEAPASELQVYTADGKVVSLRPQQTNILGTA